MMPLHRLFFALRPPLAQACCLARLGCAQRSAGYRVSLERLHLTLSLTEDFEQFPAALARRMLDTAGALETTAFPVVLDQVSGSQRSIVARPRRAPVELKRFAHQLDAALGQCGVARRRGSRFSPHVTLVYHKGDSFAARIDPIAWQAGDFVLIHSIVGQTRHIELGRWPLRPAASLFGWL